MVWRNLERNDIWVNNWQTYHEHCTEPAELIKGTTITFHGNFYWIKLGEFSFVKCFTKGFLCLLVISILTYTFFQFLSSLDKEVILLKYSRLLYEQVETLVYPIFFLWNNLICLWPYKESFMGKLVCSRQLDICLTTVELSYPSTSHKRPPPIHVSDRLSKTPKLLHLLWATMTTFWAWKFNDFPLFLSSCKRPLDTFSDLYVRCVYYAT